MQHYIIIKFNEKAWDNVNLINDISALFKSAAAIPGVHSVSLREAVLHSEIRYDLMILLRMEKEALPDFDASFIHRRWKAEFAQYIAHKVIFDCDD